MWKVYIWSFKRIHPPEKYKSMKMLYCLANALFSNWHNNIVRILIMIFNNYNSWVHWSQSTNAAYLRRKNNFKYKYGINFWKDKISKNLFLEQKEKGQNQIAFYLGYENE